MSLIWQPPVVKNLSIKFKHADVVSFSLITDLLTDTINVIRQNIFMFCKLVSKLSLRTDGNREMLPNLHHAGYTRY